MNMIDALIPENLVGVRICTIKVALSSNPKPSGSTKLTKKLFVLLAFFSSKPSFSKEISHEMIYTGYYFMFEFYTFSMGRGQHR